MPSIDFFAPPFSTQVPCNFVGTATSGIWNALFPSDGNQHQRLLNTITHLIPHLSLLWNAVVYNNQAQSLLCIALEQIPPISNVSGSWMETIQSFLMVVYYPASMADSNVTHASEMPRLFNWHRSYGDGLWLDDGTWDPEYWSNSSTATASMRCRLD